MDFIEEKFEQIYHGMKNSITVTPYNGPAGKEIESGDF